MKDRLRGPSTRRPPAVEPVAPPATSFRREAIAVLGVATLLLTVLAVSTLAAHRAAIRRLVDERDAAWAAQLSRLAAEVERGARPETLVRGVPGLLALERQPATPSLGGDPIPAACKAARRCFACGKRSQTSALKKSCQSLGRVTTSPRVTMRCS